jgi:hypothetical protein
MDEQARIHETGDWQPRRDHRIEEGGWQKPVAPPTAESRPAGLPPVSPPPGASSGTSSKEHSDA